MREGRIVQSRSPLAAPGANCDTTESCGLRRHSRALLIAVEKTEEHERAPRPSRNGDTRDIGAAASATRTSTTPTARDMRSRCIPARGCTGDSAAGGGRSRTPAAVRTPIWNGGPIPRCGSRRTQQPHQQQRRNQQQSDETGTRYLSSKTQSWSVPVIHHNLLRQPDVGHMPVSTTRPRPSPPETRHQHRAPPRRHGAGQATGTPAGNVHATGSRGPQYAAIKMGTRQPIAGASIPTPEPEPRSTTRGSDKSRAGHVQHPAVCQHGDHRHRVPGAAARRHRDKCEGAPREGQHREGN